MTSSVLIEVHAVHATDEANFYGVDCTIDDGEGDARIMYWTRPGDPHGLNPVVQQWLVDNEGQYQITPYAPPAPLTPEQIRAQMPNLTARQFWMAAANINIDKDVITATVKANMEDSIDRKVVLAELETSTFERKSETIADIMAMLQIPDEQVDDLWTWAAGL